MKTNPNHQTYKYKQYVGCASKVAYSSIEALKEGAKRLSNRFGDAIPIHAYVCKYCGKYHLTTSEKPNNGKYSDRIF